MKFNGKTLACIYLVKYMKIKNFFQRWLTKLGVPYSGNFTGEYPTVLRLI